MKKAPSYLLVVVSSMALLAMCSVCLGQAYAPGEVLVKFRPGTPGAAVAAAHRGVGGQAIKTFGTIGVQHVRLGKGVTVPGGVRAYQRNPNVVYAEPNYILYADATPNDPDFDKLWGLHNTGQTGGTPDADIDAPEAWDSGTGSSSVIVAVIDTGVDYRHTDLAENMWINQPEAAGDRGVDDDGNGYVDDIYGYDFYNGDGDPKDDNGHGTHCSGTIGAVGDNGMGVAGVNWDVEIMALKFLSRRGSGYTSDAVLCVLYATMMKKEYDHPITVLSNSWGGGAYSETLEAAIGAAGDAGILFVASAGNSAVDNDTSPHYPSSYDLDNIVAVAATDRNDVLASWSCYGQTSVDLAAPGVDVYSTVLRGRYGYKSGTSMATPHVAGAVALLEATEPGIGLAAKHRILSTVDPIPAFAGLMVSGGRLNLASAVGPPANWPPVADAGPDQTLGDYDGDGFELVTLDGLNSYDPDGTIVSYDWSQGGVSLGSGVVLLHVPFDVGVHTVTLTVQDVDELTDSDDVVITVNLNRAPVADAGPDQTVTDTDGNGSEWVTLDGSSSSDPDGTIVSYDWWQGDGFLGSGVVLLDVPFDVGVHTVTLTVTDNARLTGSDEVVVTVSAPSGTGTVTGLITYAASGDPVSGAQVTLLQNGNTVQKTRSDASGQYMFTDVPAGSGYTVKAKKGRPVGYSEPFALDPGGTEVVDVTIS